MVDIAAAVVNYLLGRMFTSLEASWGILRLQLIVASRDSSVEILRTPYPNVELIENSINLRFARANNQSLA